jgi:hypothetical protein
MRKATEGGSIKPFQKHDLATLRPLFSRDGLDQPTMRWLSKIANRKHVTVADVIYEAIESILAKWEAQAGLETKIIKFPTSLKR